MLVAMFGTICLPFSLRLTTIERFNSFKSKKVLIFETSTALHYCQHQTASSLLYRAFGSNSRVENPRCPKAERGKKEAELSDGRYPDNYQRP